jgi:uncharacterized RDD family membrane protein YckC
MQPGVAGMDGLVVSTPERVTFEYELAGLGSRFLAQAIDVVLLLLVLIAFTIMAAATGSFASDSNLALLLVILFSFLVVFGYFPVCEGIWSGQTLGKRALRIRVLGDNGAPVTVSQVAIRNLVRLVDFMPAFYGVGMITIFIQGGGKRLGDFAAGTVVARERERLKLKDLVAHAQARNAALAAPVAAAPHSIWADQQEAGEVATAGAQPNSTPSAAAPLSNPYVDAVRRMDPQMRRFVVAYAGRRMELSPARRQQLADQVGPGLARLLPIETAAFGSAAVLDGLAALIYAEMQSERAQYSVAPPSPMPPPGR